MRKDAQKTWYVILLIASAILSAATAVFRFTEEAYFEGIVFALSAIVNTIVVFLSTGSYYCIVKWFSFGNHRRKGE